MRFSKAPNQYIPAFIITIDADLFLSVVASTNSYVVRLYDYEYEATARVLTNLLKRKLTRCSSHF